MDTEKKPVFGRAGANDTAQSIECEAGQGLARTNLAAFQAMPCKLIAKREKNRWFGHG